MIVLRFEKFLTLWSYSGVPIYFNNKLVTKRTLCWWWPLNWLFLLWALPVAAYRFVTATLTAPGADDVR